VIDGDAQRAPRPRGKTSALWAPTTDSGGHAVLTIRVAQAACSVCPARPQCVHAPRPRALSIRPRAPFDALRAARHRQPTQECKERDARRAGSEGAISHGVGRGGLRRPRYSGLVKTRLLHLLIATALNVVRTAAWVAAIPRAQTRRSAFAALYDIAA